jgi:ABC-type uncharacterized transport system substrate-binding protein
MKKNKTIEALENKMLSQIIVHRACVVQDKIAHTINQQTEEQNDAVLCLGTLMCAAQITMRSGKDKELFMIAAEDAWEQFESLMEKIDPKAQ